MKFKVADAKVALQGEYCPNDQLVGDLKFIHEARKCNKGFLFQLFFLGTQLSNPMDGYQPPQLKQLLVDFQDVFEEPIGLPLPRVHDHKIPLVAGNGPVCVKPYRYPHYQKAEIERLVADMLSTGMTNVESVDQQLLSRDQVLIDLKARLREAQARMKKVYDGHHREREFEIGDWVYLKLQPCRQTSISMRKNVKLSPKYYGPFKILKKIGAMSYKLELPPESRIHIVFHVSLLKKKIGEKYPIQGELPVIENDAETLYPKPQAVLDRRQRKNKEEILIHWQGLSLAEATWENLAAMQKQFPEHSLEDKAIF
ncbi:hypothetical protein F0562_026117 [Nyssa sinensis]|uniref:Chromo domain-containing protein n=1 Tax=Nyssa sinensis TaxID=561372 RepID=A0A5J5B848_9ASTE|nr:hypothetical protein F0562_026117 [Nyssa sinensis]